jgi:hypothetical protein
LESCSFIKLIILTNQHSHRGGPAGQDDMSEAITAGSPLSILFAKWLAVGKRVVGGREAEEDAIADAHGMDIWDHKADVVSNMPRPSPDNVSMTGAGNGMCNVVCTIVDCGVMWVCLTYDDMRLSHAGWLRSSKKPSLAYSAMKAVLTLRSAMVPYPFRLCTEVQLFNECSDAKSMLSTVISCMKDQLYNLGDMGALLQTKLDATTYDSPVKKSVLKFAKDFFNEQMKLADKAEKQQEVVKSQVNSCHATYDVHDKLS